MPLVAWLLQALGVVLLIKYKLMRLLVLLIRVLLNRVVWIRPQVGIVLVVGWVLCHWIPIVGYLRYSRGR